MTGVAEGDGAAYDAEVLTGLSTEELRAELVRRGELPLIGQAYLDQRAAETEQAAEAIGAKLEGMKESLKAAKDEAKRARAEANQGGES
jgi:hypothetical protein